MSHRCHVATRKGLFLLERGPSGWRIGATAFPGENCTISMRDPRSGYLYVALDHGHFGVKLHRSDDGGANWEEIPAPKYPEKPADYAPRTPPMMGEPPDWSLKLVWSLVPGGPDQGGTLWCGTLPGGLFRSDDHGESWALNRPLWDDPLREQWFGGGADAPGIHSICVDPRDANHVVIGISCGGVWSTRDGGRSWAPGGDGMRAEFMPPERMYEMNVQDAHRVAQCAANPDVLWVQHHNGIFRSTDAGATWTEHTAAAPSPFGFAVAVHPKDPDTAWFVPAVKDVQRCADGRVVVARTRDGGRSFETLDRGLPAEHAYDLVYRHALDVDETGEVLAFGSTTGSVWVSEDGGESWQTLYEHLPPVYSVAFEKPA